MGNRSERFEGTPSPFCRSILYGVLGILILIVVGLIWVDGIESSLVQIISSQEVSGGAVNPSSCEGGCCGERTVQRPRRLDPKVEENAKAKALEYYEKKTKKKNGNAKVTDYGCHIQVDVIEDGKVVLSLTYDEGVVQEM